MSYVIAVFNRKSLPDFINFENFLQRKSYLNVWSELVY